MTSRPLDPGRPAEFRAEREVDVLVPTRDRPAELAVTLTGLAAQSGIGFGVAVSDRSRYAGCSANRGIRRVVCF